MIQERTILNVADNSGARKIRCFRVLGGTRRRYATLGDVIVASVQDALPQAAIKKGDVVKDKDGMETMAVLGENMAWLLKKIKGSKG